LEGATGQEPARPDYVFDWIREVRCAPHVPTRHAPPFVLCRCSGCPLPANSSASAPNGSCFATCSSASPGLGLLVWGRFTPSTSLNLHAEPGKHWRGHLRLHRQVDIERGLISGRV